MTFFARFDPLTFYIISSGSMSQELIENEIAQGEHTIILEEPLSDPKRAYFDPDTGGVVYRDPPPPTPFVPANYVEARLTEYPPLGELADALFWREQGDDSKWEAYVSACSAVKAKYPKP